MAELIEQRRIGPCDCLVLVLADLERTAPLITGDFETLHRWLSAAVDLLSAVPDVAQRMSWAVTLAQAICRPPWSVEIIAGDLLFRAQEVRDAVATSLPR